MRYESLKRCQHFAFLTINTDTGRFNPPAKAMTWLLWERHAQLCCICERPFGLFPGLVWLCLLDNLCSLSTYVVYTYFCLPVQPTNRDLLFAQSPQRHDQLRSTARFWLPFHPEKLMIFIVAARFLFSSSAWSDIKHVRVFVAVVKRSALICDHVLFQTPLLLAGKTFVGKMESLLPRNPQSFQNKCTCPIRSVIKRPLQLPSLLGVVFV